MTLTKAQATHLAEEISDAMRRAVPPSEWPGRTEACVPIGKEEYIRQAKASGYAGFRWGTCWAIQENWDCVCGEWMPCAEHPWTS